MTEPTSPTIWIDIPGGRLAAQDEGSGPPVLLVHSAIVNRRSWDPVVPLLVEAGYRVIRYDMRGFGDSSAEEIEYQPHADVLAVLDHFGVERAAIGGNSMGGAFALDAVLEAPGPIRRLRLDRRRHRRLRQARRPGGGGALPGRRQRRGRRRLGPRGGARHPHLGRWLGRRRQPADDSGRPGRPGGDQGLGSRAPRARARSSARSSGPIPRRSSASRRSRCRRSS